MTLYKSDYQIGGYENLQLAINQAVIYILSCLSSKSFTKNLKQSITPYISK